jgi:hypothetical protein
LAFILITLYAQTGISLSWITMIYQSRVVLMQKCIYFFIIENDLHFYYTNHTDISYIANLITWYITINQTKMPWIAILWGHVSLKSKIYCKMTKHHFLLCEYACNLAHYYCRQQASLPSQQTSNNTNCMHGIMFMKAIWIAINHWIKIMLNI